MYYELIYENGDHSVMFADTREEALTGIKEQHRRATSGERSLSSDPNSPPASRIKRVLEYEDHPGSFGEDQMVTPTEAKAAVEAHTKDGKVDIQNLVSTLRNLSNPLIDNAGAHETKYQMKEKSELDEKEWS